MNNQFNRGDYVRCVAFPDLQGVVENVRDDGAIMVAWDSLDRKCGIDSRFHHPDAFVAAKPEKPAEPLSFTYRDYRGDVSERKVTVLGLRHGTSEWHKAPQWLMRAFDHGKNAEREFAVSGMYPSNVFRSTPALEVRKDPDPVKIDALIDATEDLLAAINVEYAHLDDFVARVSEALVSLDPDWV